MAPIAGTFGSSLTTNQMSHHWTSQVRQLGDSKQKLAKQMSTLAQQKAEATDNDNSSSEAGIEARIKQCEYKDKQLDYLLKTAESQLKMVQTREEQSDKSLEQNIKKSFSASA